MDVSEHVMNGLIEFLKQLKRIVPPNLYGIAETGFFNFGSDCWLRQQLGHNPGLTSEEEIRLLLATS